MTGALALPGQEPPEAAERPSLSIEPDGPGRWRIRSWEWQGSAWRPTVAHAAITPSGARVEGRVAALDRQEVRAWLAASVATA